MSKKEGKIISVLGNIRASDLGYCQCHEHLFIKKGRLNSANPALLIDNENLTRQELFLYKKSGGRSIVDAQPVGCGRMAKELVAASRSTGINIIASTGFHKMSFYPEGHWIFTTDQESFYKLMIEEIRTGMYIDGDFTFPEKQISSRTGIIKTAYEIGENAKNYQRLLVAAARASMETGVTIICHIEKSEGAMEAVEILLTNGVNKKSIIICHLDRRVDNFPFHAKVAETGVFLDFDTIGRFKYHLDKQEIELIRKMIQGGYEDNILLALDTTRERMKSYGGDIGLDYILTEFATLLEKYGMDYNYLEKFNVINSREALRIKKEVDNNGHV